MGKGHFACLGCNGYFATGHWGGDGTAVSVLEPSGGSEPFQLRRAQRRRKQVRDMKVFELTRQYLEMKLNDTDN